MIKFEQVSVRYPNGFMGLNELSFHIPRGEFCFLTGHSGAGKSTVLRLIALLTRPDAGAVTVGGMPLHQLRKKDIPALRRHMGIILQTPHLLPDKTVHDNVALPLVIGGFGYREIQSRVRSALAKVDLGNREKYYPEELSTGEQQRVAIARAIIARPPLLIADEPTGNLDHALAAEIMHLFMQFQSLGTTLLVVTHDLALISRMQQRILTLKEGRLIHE